MATFLQRIRQKRRARRAAGNGQARQAATGEQPVQPGVAQAMDTAPNDSIEEGPAGASPASEQASTTEAGAWQVLGTRQIPSEVGNERLAVSYVVEALKAFNLSARRLDQLGTAVAEATMNAMEHGNHYNPEVPVTLQVLSANDAIAVRISDQGGNGRLHEQKAYETPDIEAKLAELQSPRGWGLFLIQNMVDEMRILSDEKTHTIELILRLEGDAHVHQNA